MRRYVIIGSGAAGISAAETLRENDPTGKVVLVTGDRFGYYSRPGLAYLLAGEVDEGQLFPYRPEMMKKMGVEWITAHVERVDPLAHRLHLKDERTIDYDRLLLATGATAVIPDLPGIHLEGVVKLDNFEDIHRILKRAQRGKEVVVVGGGITALELVEGLAARNMRVHYLLRGERYWSSILDEHESLMVQEQLKEDGVRLHTNVQVSEVYGRHNAVEGVLTQDGNKIKGRMAAFAVGIRPRLELARSARIKRQTRHPGQSIPADQPAGHLCRRGRGRTDRPGKRKRGPGKPVVPGSPAGSGRRGEYGGKQPGLPAGLPV